MHVVAWPGTHDQLRPMKAPGQTSAMPVPEAVLTTRPVRTAPMSSVADAVAVRPATTFTALACMELVVPPEYSAA